MFLCKLQYHVIANLALLLRTRSSKINLQMRQKGKAYLDGDEAYLDKNFQQICDTVLLISVMEKAGLLSRGDWSIEVMDEGGLRHMPSSNTAA